MHTCKSMFCHTCGAKRRDKISANVAKKVLDIPHRQLVFTVPTELRNFFRKYREQISLIFNAVNETLTSVVKDKAPLTYKKKQRRPGFISFLHTFGRDLKWHPHIHVLFAEKTIDKSGEMKDVYFLKYDYVRKYFLYSLIKKIRKFISTSSKVDEEMKTFFTKKINEVQIRLKNGAYFYGKKTHIATSINSVKKCQNIQVGTHHIQQFQKEEYYVMIHVSGIIKTANWDTATDIILMLRGLKQLKAI